MALMAYYLSYWICIIQSGLGVVHKPGLGVEGRVHLLHKHRKGRG